MSRIVWTFGWIAVATWSVVCAAAYGLFDLIGRVSMRNADVFSTDPYTVEWVWRVMSAVHSLSTGAVLTAWAIVSLLILAVPWTLDRMMAVGPARRGLVPEPVRPSRDGVIDLGPDQYSVRPAVPPAGSGGWSGTPPRIPPGRPGA